MADDQGVWGIDIGQAGLKAIRLKYAEASGQVLAVAFDYIAHPKILSQPDAIPGELIQQALEKFLSRNKVANDKIAISVPGQTSLIRFIQLPPVESSKVAEIVKYEARQQIPFALEEVCWQWQTLGSGTEEGGFMVDAEVGLFAMKRDQVMHQMQPFSAQQVEVDFIQCAPLALYNFLSYDILGMRADEEFAPADEYTIVLDMGADNTSLLVTNGEKIWPRNVPIGGNHFTRALTKSMKLTFAKAEHLKCNATKSPDPRAVFQALRPVFNDYVSEIQRSIGYFSSVNRNAKIGKIIGLGNGFKLAGLQKFLQQNLQYEVQKLDSFKTPAGDAILKAPMFQENIMSFAVPYGLALQGLGLGKINVDLLPEEIRTQRMIRTKKPWVLATAASLLLGLALSITAFARGDRAVGEKRWGGAVKKAQGVTSEAAKFKSDYSQQQNNYRKQQDTNNRLVKPGEDRLLWLELQKAVAACLPRDEADKYKDYELRKKNRVKIEMQTHVFVKDVNSWFKLVPKSIRDKMLPADRDNPPEGPGFIVTLHCHHYHNGETIDSFGEVWAQKNFVDHFKKWRVTPLGSDEFAVREIGITHPIISAYSVAKPFQYEIDMTKLDEQAQEEIKNKVKNDKKHFSEDRALEKFYANVDRYEFWVAFVWQPRSREKQIVYSALYDFFRSNPSDKSFQKAKEFCEMNGAQKLEQADYDDFKKRHLGTVILETKPLESGK